MSKRIARFPALLLAVIFLAALGLTWFNLSAALPRGQWGGALAAPDIDNIQQMLFHYSLLPRLAISLLVGAGLGLVGVLFQQVLRNPLAEPTTLGVATGALWDHGHHAVVPAGGAGLAVCRTRGGVRGGGAGLWRGLGQTSFSRDADSRRAGGEPLLRGD